MSEYVDSRDVEDGTSLHLISVLQYKLKSKTVNDEHWTRTTAEHGEANPISSPRNAARCLYPPSLFLLLCLPIKFSFHTILLEA